MLSLLIPPQYQLAAKAAAVVAVLSAAFLSGVRFEAKRWDAAIAVEQLQSAQVQAAAVQRANDVAQELARSKYNQQVEHEKAIEDINDLRDKLAATRLRDNHKGGSSNVPQGGQVPGVDAEAGGTDLSTEASEFLRGEALRADQYAEQLNACIGRVKSIERQLGAP